MKKRIVPKGFLILSTAIIVSCALKASGKNIRVLFILDASKSMLDTSYFGVAKFSRVRKMIIEIADSIYQRNDSVEFSLRVFGHNTHGDGCYVTANEVGFSQDNIDQLTSRLYDIQPEGSASVPYAIKRAVTDDIYDTSTSSYFVVIFLDSKECCKRDGCMDRICLEVNELSKKIGQKVFIVCFQRDVVSNCEQSDIRNNISFQDEINNISLICDSIRKHIPPKKNVHRQILTASPLPPINVSKSFNANVTEVLQQKIETQSEINVNPKTNNKSSKIVVKEISDVPVQPNVEPILRKKDIERTPLVRENNDSLSKMKGPYLKWKNLIRDTVKVNTNTNDSNDEEPIIGSYLVPGK